MKGFLSAVMLVAMAGTGARGQAAAEGQPDSRRQEPDVLRTFYLSSVTQVNDANEILNALRNIVDPRVKVLLTPSENAITIRGAADQVALAERLLKELDRPKKTFRLVYTVTEMDGAKKIGVQHFSMVLASGVRTVMKEGSRVPLVMASFDAGGTSGNKTQVTYVDVGLNIDATVDGYVDGVRLRSKVEQSSVATETTGAMLQGDPVIRQTLLEGTSILTQGKPLVLGTLDVPGSTRHLEVEVVLELVP